MALALKHRRELPEQLAKAAQSGDIELRQGLGVVWVLREAARRTGLDVSPAPGGADAGRAMERGKRPPHGP